MIIIIKIIHSVYLYLITILQLLKKYSIVLNKNIKNQSNPNKKMLVLVLFKICISLKMN